MNANGLAGDLEWWRAHRASPARDMAAMRDVLERLKAWKVQHDQDRAGQPGPFLQMVWDGIFGDENSAVVEAIAEIETALSSPLPPSGARERIG